MTDKAERSGVYAVCWRWRSEPRVARHWAYYLSSDEMEAAVARADGEDAAIVVKSAGWLPIDDMLIAS
jgi:hypothetical protein